MSGYCASYTGSSIHSNNRINTKGIGKSSNLHSLVWTFALSY